VLLSAQSIDLEFAPEYAAPFEKLVGRLRATREWSNVEREIDVRFETVL
jgi:hypothetical protein